MEVLENAMISNYRINIDAGWNNQLVRLDMELVIPFLEYTQYTPKHLAETKHMVFLTDREYKILRPILNMKEHEIHNLLTRGGNVGCNPAEVGSSPTSKTITVNINDDRIFNTEDMD